MVLVLVLAAGCGHKGAPAVSPAPVRVVRGPGQYVLAWKVAGRDAEPGVLYERAYLVPGTRVRLAGREPPGDTGERLLWVDVLGGKYEGRALLVRPEDLAEPGGDGGPRPLQPGAE